ncbi:MAG: outer membrane beta-barrel protein [Xanthomonadales bacterium]|nr:outer membrane beta-barrel protein [Xanthomonadales bacterium]
MNTRRSSTSLVIVGTAMLLYPSFAPAQDTHEIGQTDAGGDTGWCLRLDLAWVNPSGSIVSVDADHGGHFDLNMGAGAGLRGEYRTSDRLGVEIGLLSAGNIDLAAGSFARHGDHGFSVGGFSMFSVGLNLHLTDGSPIDLYLGPQLALINYGSVDFRAGHNRSGAELSADEDFAFGAIVGVDVPLGESGWMIHSSVRYVGTDYSYSVDGSDYDSSFDPTIFSIGFGYRF